MKKGMIKVSVLYPSGVGNTFDMDYYCNKHVPMAASLLEPALKGATVDKGLASDAPESPPPYLAVANLYFDSVDAFQNTFGPNAEKIMGDMPNYTNAQPVIQISEVLLA
jgi:uncharacterized protein (TIGR02118 family)